MRRAPAPRVPLLACAALTALAAAAPASAAPTPEELERSVTPLTGPVERLRWASTVRPLVGRVRAGRTVVPADVLFAFDLAEVRPAGRRALVRLAESMARRPGQLRVVGHTDGVGRTGYNRALSRRRADAVASLLRAALPRSVSISASGRGSTDPVADETTPEGRDDPDGRARNRRVELRFEAR